MLDAIITKQHEEKNQGTIQEKNHDGHNNDATKGNDTPAEIGSEFPEANQIDNQN
jgi:hypothetical protein